MAWDDDKSTSDDLTADEWDAHVTDQKNHASRHEKGGSDELTTFGNTTIDQITGPSGQGPYVPGVDFPGAGGSGFWPASAVVTADGTRYELSDNGDDLGQAFNAAMDDATPSETTVYLPQVDTFSTAMVADVTGITVVGPGSGDPLEYTGTDAAFKFHNNRVALQNVNLRGSGNDGNGAVGITFEGTQGTQPHCSVQNFRIDQFDGPAIKCRDDAVIFETTIDNGLITDIYDATAAVDLGGSSGNSDVAGVVVDRVRATAGTISGDFINMSGTGINKQIYRCIAEPSVEGRGFVVTKGEIAKVCFNKAELNTGGSPAEGGFDIQNNNNVLVMGNYALDCQDYGFRFNNCGGHCTFMANREKGTQGNSDGALFETGFTQKFTVASNELQQGYTNLSSIDAGQYFEDGEIRLWAGSTQVRLFNNSSGELVAEDDASNQTTLT